MSEKKILSLLKKTPSGLTITELVDLSGLSRSFVRTILARLEGAQKVVVRKVGMAKVYIFKEEK